jgi:subtilisin-like proprotein convertase family protein
LNEEPDEMKMLKSNALAIVAVILLAGLACVQAQGQPVTNTTSTTVNSQIPDGNPVGMTSSTTLSDAFGTISSVTVTIDITGGFNGDLYAYLAGPAGGFAVLLNRVGLGSSNPFGYSDTGFNVTFSDGNPDIHNYQIESPTMNGSGQLTGTWAPDGRNIDPQSSPSLFDSTLPTAELSSFEGDAANGAWTLFVGDLSSGGQATLVSWGLTVVTIPEPQTWALAMGGMGLLLALNRRRRL